MKTLIKALNTPVELTSKQVNLILAIGSVLFVGAVVFALCVGTVSNLGALGF